MATHFRIDVNSGLVWSIYEGHIRLEDVLDQWRSIAAHPDFSPSFDVIVDVSAITVFDVGKDAQVVLAGIADPFARSSARLMVAPTDLMFGMLRLYEAYGESKHPNLHITRSLPEALTILSESRSQRSGTPAVKQD